MFSTRLPHPRLPRLFQHQVFLQQRFLAVQRQHVVVAAETAPNGPNQSKFTHDLPPVRLLSRICLQQVILSWASVLGHWTDRVCCRVHHIQIWQIHCLNVPFRIFSSASVWGTPAYGVRGCFLLFSLVIWTIDSLGHILPVYCQGNAQTPLFACQSRILMLFLLYRSW